jgi:myo-inositol-1(or 4)-monophosphatase
VGGTPTWSRGLAAALEAEGVRVAGAVRRGRVPRQTRLVAYRSDLRRTLKVMLTDSQNLYAECTLKRLGAGSFASGGEAVLRALARLEVDPAGVVVADGSGLARANRVTARALYGTLHAMRKRPIFVEALAAGGEGTLRRRYRELGARVRAKTGTIRGVRSLSGYVTGRGGHRYVFVILANGRSAADPGGGAVSVLATATELAAGAGEILASHYGHLRRGDAARKTTQRDLVSKADLESQRFLIERIPAADDILAEEGSSRDAGADRRWVIDPLDGTVNFLHGLPFWCVSLAVVDRGELAAAVVHAPELGQTFTAAAGEGAFCNGEPVSVSATPELAESILATGFAYRRNELPDNNFDNFTTLGLAAAGVRRMGSAALDLSYVACGRLDGFWELHLEAWDVAAGTLLVREAGGTVTDFRGGEELDAILFRRHVVASNGRIHGAIRERLAPLRGPTV